MNIFSVQMVSLPSRLSCLEEGYLELLPAARLARAYGNEHAVGEVQKKNGSGMICRSSSPEAPIVEYPEFLSDGF